MKAQSNDPKLTELAADPSFTVADYEAAVAAQDKDKIADALHRRFKQRYIDPVTHSPSKQMHGFTMMAVSCLMIEAFESFRQGWKDSNERGRGKLPFCCFFDSNNCFKDFRGFSQQFYKNVRCGILHQAETTGGWKITRVRKAPLFQPSPLPTINANLFLRHLGTVLDSFRDELKSANWNSEEWKNVKVKMKALCENCGPSSTSQ